MMKTNELLQGRVHLEQVRQLIVQAPAALGAMPVAMLLSTIVIWGGVPHSLAIAWCVSVLVIVLTRWGLVTRFRKFPPDVEGSFRWANYYAWLELASGLVWASLSLMTPMLDVERQMYLYVAYLGMTAGAVVIIAPMFSSVLAYVVPYTVATAFASYMVGGSMSVVLSFAAVLFGATILRVGWTMNRTLKESYALRFENVDLLADVRKTAANLAAESKERREVETRLRLSQMEYQNVLENMEDTYYRTAIDGSILYTSPSVHRLLGYKREELVGQNMGSLYSDDNNREAFLKQLAASGGALRNYEVHLRHKSGSLIWVSVASRYWHDESGKVMGVEGVAREITDVKEAQELVLKAKNEYQSLVEFLREVLNRVPSGMVILNEKLEIEFVNDELKRATGAPTHGRYQAQGVPLSALPSVARTGYVYVLDDLKKGFSFQKKMPFTSIFGKEALFEVKGVPLMTDGVFKGAVLVAVDVSEQERTQAELRRALELSEEIGRAKTALLANVSHELRTPLNGILGAAHLLMSSTLSDADMKYVNLLYRSAETLLTLVNQILDLSKLEAGKMEQSARPVALREALVTELDLLSMQAQQKMLRFAIEVAPQVPAVVELDIAWLRSILLNLVGNALKFTEKGEVRLVVEPARGEATPMLHFVVSDTGIGIAPEQIARIFDSFTQADPSLTRRYGGTGLGTTIAKELVTRMGGRIWVESEVGAGSRFHFLLPMLIPLEGRTFNTPRVQRDALPTPITRSEFALKILLVEDNQINQLILKDMLMRQGHQVRVVDDGEMALNVLDQQEFDVILMDIQMPRMDGMQATRELRARGILTPVIAMTAHAMSGERAACLASGMNDFVVKPVDLDALNAILVKYLPEIAEASTWDTAAIHE